MQRLIKHGLMFGNLVHVETPALVERYDRALFHLTGKHTQLSDFHVDISGYSPEIGDELGDHQYLNKNGVNRQFILLTTEQKKAPLLHATFSTSRDILRRFIDANEAQLFALTALDAVAGELVNSAFEVTRPDVLLNLRKIRIDADTTEGTLKTADKLAELVNRFRHEEDAWFDDVLISRMISHAKDAGDITRNPIRLSDTEFEQKNFWTSHFGGVYLFQGVDHPAAISVGDKSGLEKLAIKYVFDFSDRNRIAKFLSYNDLVEPIIKTRGGNTADILQQKMDFIVIDRASSAGIDLSGLSRTDLRRLTREYSELLPLEYEGLADLYNWAKNGGDWPRISSDHPAYFYTLRASDTPDADLVNRMLADLTPLDIRQLFICNKESFYRRYQTWPDAKKDFVVSFLAREYLVDKVAAREALFGHEPEMAEDTSGSSYQDLVRRVGPWGALGKI